MEISAVRIYLLAGLLLHKAVWEMLKAGKQRTPAPRPSMKARMLSGVKIAVLLAIVAQTLLPPFLPIRNSPAWLPITGVVFYSLGLAMAVSARLQLGRNWSDIEKSRVNPDHALVARGLYRYLRHPIYTGDLLLLFGLELALNSWCVLGVVVVMLYVRRQAIQEEKLLIDAIPGYAGYCRRTPRFFPLLSI